MDIIACIKRVPDTAETDAVRIDGTGKDIEKSGLAHKINDWDEYTLETAARLKEKHGGTFTAITVGPKDWDEVLRRALAMGADRAIRIDEDVHNFDTYDVATILTRVIRDQKFDLILFGAQSEDFGCGQLGATVGEMLGLPHATLVVSLEIDTRTAHIQREIEGGGRESYSIELPALLTIQTGINQPRYISLAGIRRAMKTELEVKTLGDLGMSSTEFNRLLKLERFVLPPAGKKAEILSGLPEEAAEKLVRILQNSGIL
jgi:electron transfer flavoprotein beta subunit